VNPSKKESLGDLKKNKNHDWKAEKQTSGLKKNDQVLSLIEHSDWIIDQSAIWGYNPSTHTILNYCSTGDTQQVKSLGNPVN